jgi:hypothetical protein
MPAGNVCRGGSSPEKVTSAVVDVQHGVQSVPGFAIIILKG